MNTKRMKTEAGLKPACILDLQNLFFFFFPHCTSFCSIVHCLFLTSSIGKEIRDANIVYILSQHKKLQALNVIVSFHGPVQFYSLFYS